MENRKCYIIIFPIISYHTQCLLQYTRYTDFRVRLYIPHCQSNPIYSIVYKNIIYMAKSCNNFSLSHFTWLDVNGRHVMLISRPNTPFYKLAVRVCQRHNNSRRQQSRTTLSLDHCCHFVGIYTSGSQPLMFYAGPYIDFQKFRAPLSMNWNFFWYTLQIEVSQVRPEKKSYFWRSLSASQSFRVYHVEMVWIRQK